MTYQFTSPDTGATFTYPDFDAYDAAEEWKNLIEKEDIIDFCKARGVDLVGPDGNTLVDGWHDIAMHTYALSRGRA